MGNADFENANCSEADFSFSKGAITKFLNADLRKAVFVESELKFASFQNATLCEAIMDGIDLSRTNLAGANFSSASLRKSASGKAAILRFADISGCLFNKAQMQGCDVSNALVERMASFLDAIVDDETDLSYVPLSQIQMNHKTRCDLERNRRKLSWNRYYKENGKVRTLPWQIFWWMSDYGRSTKRLILVFFVSSTVFASLYWGAEYLGEFNVQPLIANLSTVDGRAVDPYYLPFRALYFSIVTTTTLGFGDMYANPHSFFAYPLIMIHVIFGYLLMAAIVTRLAILFQSEGAE